ncbi:MAG: hypothetical protein ABSG64_13990 [Solirubrobacteraceae bacterium]|jgi:hypothetical protein
MHLTQPRPSTWWFYHTHPMHEVVIETNTFALRLVGTLWAAVAVVRLQSHLAALAG